MAHLRLLNLKSTILGDAPDEDGEDAEDDAKRKEEACAELTQLLDDQSLSLVRERDDDGRRALQILTLVRESHA